LDNYRQALKIFKQIGVKEGIEITKQNIERIAQNSDS